MRERCVAEAQLNSVPEIARRECVVAERFANGTSHGWWVLFIKLPV